MKPCLANFRFYEERNDFVSGDHYKQTIAYRFGGQPAIKDPIEALGVPHTEVDLILVNDYRVLQSTSVNYASRSDLNLCGL